MELLTEDWGSIEAPLIMESHNGGNTLTGIFMQAEITNRNGRIYPKRVLEEALESYMAAHKGKLMLGELGHPSRANIDISESCIVIEDMWWEGNNVMGRAKVLSDDGGNGEHLQKLIDAGWVPGVSTRGLGSLTESNGSKIVNPGYKLTVPVDIVFGPSAQSAYLSVE